MPDPTAPIVNVPLLRKAVEWAEAEAAKPFADSEWYQPDCITPPARLNKAPTCGTCYCIAGYVGASLDERYAQKVMVNGVHVVDFAGEALGLPMSGTAALTDGLFSGSNTIEDVRRIAESIAGERL